MRQRLFLFLLTLLMTALLWAQTDPNIQWKMVRLPHFDLIFDAKHQELAGAYAAHLEEVANSLSTVFTHTPEKTLIVLNDRTDLTNGYATPLPTSTIVLFPVMPGPLESIYEHGNWPRELVMHEYTHILSFEPRRGAVKVLHSMFGSIITPNILLPRWWLEGVAVEMETRQSSFGRLRSVGQDASLRSYDVDQTLFSVKLAEINETTIPNWPGGARPYIFGSLMWSYMLSQKDLQLVDTLHVRHGGRIPYFINTPVEDVMDRDYETLFIEMKEDLQKRITAQMIQLRKITPHSADAFTSKFTEAFSPSISPDGLKMIYLIKDETTKRSIRILQRPSLQTRFDESQELGKVTQRLIEQGSDLKPVPGRMQAEDGPPTGTISRMSWFPDSQRFIFDKVTEINHFHERSDLWIYDLEKNKAEALTEGFRAREPSVSPGGDEAVFVKLGPGSTQIGKIRIADKATEILYTPELFATVSFPSYINSEEIVFTERSRQGEERLLKLHLSDKSIQAILTNYAQPRLSKMSSEGLLFVSSQNHVQNLYLAAKDLKSAKPLTHSLTGISASDWDPATHELYITELSSKGQQIKILKLTETQRLQKSQLPVTAPLFADRYETKKAPAIPPTPELAIEDYSPSSYLWPHYWFPGLYVGTYGVFVSAMTAGSDPVGLHSYNLGVGYDTNSQESNYNITYLNHVWTPAIIASAIDYKYSVPLTGFELRKKWQTIESQWQLAKISTDLDLITGWDWRSTEFTNSTKTFSTGPKLGVQYSDFTQAGAQISPESGQGIRLVDTSFIHDDVKRGFNELQFSLVKFFSKWLPSRHAIMFKAQGRWIEEQVNLGNYESSVAYALYSNPLYPQYLMRGYRTGQFLAKSLVNYTLEYRFPLLKVYHGSGTTPFFFKQFHGALLAEGIQLDGYAYREDWKDLTSFPFESVPKWKIFSDVGAELRVDMTIGYHFPLTYYIGVYAPSENQYQKDSPQYGMGFLF